MSKAKAVFRVLCLITLIMLAAGGGLNPVYAESPDANKTARILHFPENRSLGIIMVQDINSQPLQGYEYHFWVRGNCLGQAQGDVVIPAGKKAGLFLNGEAIKDLSPLLNLKPDDLYMLSPQATIREQVMPQRCMQNIAHLTGLKILLLFGITTPTESMEHITKLQSLEVLTIPKGFTNRGLSFVSQLKSLKALYFDEDNKVTNAALGRHLPKLVNLEKLSLHGEQISDEGLEHLKDLPRLRELSLNSGNFTSEGLAYLKECPALQNLDLKHLPVADGGIKYLAGHQKLEDLDLYNTKVTDRGLQFLKTMPSLRKLNIGKRQENNNQITDAGMVHIAQLGSLEDLDLPNHGITDKGLAYITGLKNLKHLWVSRSSNSPLTDISLKHISKLESLECLQISGTGFTDAGMDDIAALTNLKKLHLWGNSITNQGLAKLKTLKSLEDISLCCKKVTISGLSQLNSLNNLSKLEILHGLTRDGGYLDISGLTSLEDLRLRTDAPIEDKDLVCLLKLKNLKELAISGVLSGSIVTDAGISNLKDLPDLQELYCRSPYLTDKSLYYLANIKALNFLMIGGKFTDEGLAYLEESKSLRSLNIYSASHFSLAAVRRFKEKRPDINFVIDEQLQSGG